MHRRRCRGRGAGHLLRERPAHLRVQVQSHLGHGRRCPAADTVTVDLGRSSGGNAATDTKGFWNMTQTNTTRISRAGFLAASAGLVLAACGQGSNNSPAASPGATDATPVAGSAAPTSTVAVPAGSVVPAPLLGASTIDGTGFDANTLAGRPTVAWFWAPWCVICRGEAPDVAAIATQYADRVNFIGVAGRGEAPEMRDFVSDTGTGGFTHLDDSSGAIWAAYEIYAQPAFAFITDDGRQETFTGALGADDLAQVIEQLLVA